MKQLALTAALISFNALAAPQFNSYWSGSYHFIDATNNEDRAYNCSFTHTFAYDDFGERKTRTITGNFGIAAKSSRNVAKLTGSWVNPATTDGPKIQCN